MTPVILIGGIIGIYYGLLVTYRCFLLPNISPVLMSLSIIAIIAFSKGDSNGHCLAIATSIGALLQLLVQHPAVRKLGFTIRPNLNFKNNPEFKNLVELVFPAALSSTIGQIYVYVDKYNDFKYFCKYYYNIIKKISLNKIIIKIKMLILKRERD